MNKQEFLDLCGAYALGALDGEDLVRFRLTTSHADAEMREALADALKTAATLSLAAPAATPSSIVRDRLMARVSADLAGIPRRAPAAATSSAPATVARPALQASPSSDKRPLIERLFGVWMQPRLGLAVAFSMLVLAAGFVAYSLSLKQKLTTQQLALVDTHQRMDALADSTRSRITALQDSLSQKTAMLEVLKSRQMQMVAMGGMQDSTGYGKIIWDPERKVAVLQVSLPPEPEGMSYQLWVIRDKKPMDAGVFQVHSNVEGGALYRIEQLVETDRKHIDAFAVTLEPKGGMPRPTGKTYLMGEMGPI